MKAVPATDFRLKSTLGIAVTVILIVTPLSINHFLNSQYLMGTGALVLVNLFVLIAWSCIANRYNPNITFVVLVPCITLLLVYTLRTMGIIGVFWCYPTVLAFYFILYEKQAWISNAAFLVIVLPQAWTVLGQADALRFTLTLIAVGVFSTIFVRVITRQQEKLEDQAVTDPLTGLLNRTLLHETLVHAVEQNHRMGAPMTLVSLDLDNFKAVNDTLGHNAGDAVLRNVGELLRDRIRRSDKVFRLGGEEFLALLYDTDTSHGINLAEDLRSTIEMQSVLPDHPVTASLGIATLQPGEDWDNWMKRCDENLYRAKLNGRNMVVS